MLLARRLAGEKLLGNPADPVGFAPDYERADELLAVAGVTRADAEAVARRALEERWDSVVTVALALLVLGELNGEQIGDAIYGV